MLWNSSWFPGTNLLDINLDWILKKFKALRGGSAGQYLYKKSDSDFDFGWKTGSGEGGASDYLDLDNKPSINNVELTGNKTAVDLGLATPSDIPAVPVQSVNGMTGAIVLSASDLGAYVKPAGGIPKTDLSSAVQTSLDKADTALQAVPPTYRTAAAQDVIDAAQDGDIGLLINGNVPENNVVKGQYVILRNSTISGKADGLYRAEASMTAGQTIDGSYLGNQITIGGLNAVIATTTMQLATIGTPYSGLSMYYARWWRCGNIVVLNLNFKVDTDIPTNTVAFTLSDIPLTAVACIGMCVSASLSQYAGMLEIGAQDNTFTVTTVGTLKAGNYIRTSFTYICQ